MALALSALIFVAIFYGGYHVSKWAHKSWYPPRLMLWMGVSLVGGVSATAAIGCL